MTEPLISHSPPQLRPDRLAGVNRFALLLPLAVSLLVSLPAAALERTNTTFKIFQFPPGRIPTIDGRTNDWDIVPGDYVIGTDQLVDDSGKHAVPDPKTLDVRVKVGWVKGLNRLYFLYEAEDDYWDFADPGLHNDTFELVVDGDLSGGPFIERFHPAKGMLSRMDAYFSFQGVHAQNYHIFTPAEGKDWCLAWDAAQWIKELPYANAAWRLRFQARPARPPGPGILDYPLRLCRRRRPAARRGIRAQGRQNHRPVLGGD